MAKSKPNTELLEKLTLFIEQTPISRLSRNLRNLLLEHLALQTDGNSFDLPDLLNDLLNLFELLDGIDPKQVTVAELP